MGDRLCCLLRGGLTLSEEKQMQGVVGRRVGRGEGGGIVVGIQNEKI